MNLAYDVEADWTLLRTCNFRCDYCFIPVTVLRAKMEVYASVEKWVEGFAATGKSWLLHITGGEPSIYPGFVDLCRGLARNHYLSLNSNLSHRSIDLFAETVAPERVHFINAAMHYEERLRSGTLDTFLDRVARLRMRGFNVLVSLMMTPAAIGMFPEIAGCAARREVVVIPKAIRGDYRGRKYPDAYSDEERAVVSERLAEARASYAQVISALGEPATIDLFSEDRFLHGIGSYRGRMCGSGYNFVKINPKGDVIRCGSTRRLGNILQKNVHFLRRPKPCDTSYCPYFCEKYTSPRFVGTPEASDRSGRGLLSILTGRLRRRDAAHR